MKGIFKLGALVTIVGMLQACSGMVTIAEREDYAQPKWYANCVETGSKGWFWWKQDYVFACGAGEGVFQQAAEEQMYAIANTQLEFSGSNGAETKKTKTLISYVVKDTTIREHIAKETGTFKYQGKMYTFVKLRMNKEVFDQLIAEAKNAKASQTN